MAQKMNTGPGKRADDAVRRPSERFMLPPDSSPGGRLSDGKDSARRARVSKGLVALYHIHRNFESQSPLSRETKQEIIRAIEDVKEPNPHDKFLLRQLSHDGRFPKRIQKAASDKLEELGIFTAKSGAESYVGTDSFFDRFMAEIDKVRPYNK